MDAAVLLALFLISAVGYGCYRDKKKRSAVGLVVKFKTSRWKRRSIMVQLSVAGKALAMLTAVDAKGNPVPSPTFDASPAWSVDDSGLVTMTVSQDGLTAELLPVGPVGKFTVQVNATVGGVALSGSAVVELVTGPAASLAINISIQ